METIGSAYKLAHFISNDNDQSQFREVLIIVKTYYFSGLKS